MIRLTLSFCLCFCTLSQIINVCVFAADTATQVNNQRQLDALRKDLVLRAGEAVANVDANPNKPVQVAARKIPTYTAAVVSVANDLKDVAHNLQNLDGDAKKTLEDTANNAAKNAGEASKKAQALQETASNTYTDITKADALRAAADLRTSATDADNLAKDALRFATDAKNVIDRSHEDMKDKTTALVTAAGALTKATTEMLKAAVDASDLATTFATTPPAEDERTRFETFVNSIKRFGLAKLRKFEGGSNRAPVEIDEYRDAEIEFNEAYADYEKNPVRVDEAKPLFNAYRQILVATTSGRDFMTKARDVGRPVFQTRQEERVAVIKYENWIERGSVFVRQDGVKKVRYLVPTQRPAIASGTHYVGEANAPMYEISAMELKRAERLKSKVSDVPIERQLPDDFEPFRAGNVFDRMTNGDWFDKFIDAEHFYYRGFVKFELANAQSEERIAGFHYVASTDENLRPTKAWVVVLTNNFSTTLIPSTNLGQAVKLSDSGILMLAKPTSGNRVFIFFEKEFPLNVSLDPNNVPDTDFVLPELRLIKTTKEALAPSTPQ